MRKITFNGQTNSIAAWSRETGVSPALIRYRLAMGWSVADALHVTPNPRYHPRRRALTHKAALKLSDVLPALSVENNLRELDRMRREMRRALRTMIRHTEREAAAIGRTFSIAIAEMLDGQHRGAVENFAKNAGDRTHSSAQERL